jgi:hypothetical protein
MADNYIVLDNAGNPLTMASNDLGGAGVHSPKVSVIDESGNVLGAAVGSPIHVRPGDGTTGADVLAAGADANANTLNQLIVAAFGYLFNGTTFDRMRGDTTNGLDVDVTRVGGTVSVTDVSVTAPVGAQVASADTAEHAFGAQAVKAPVTIQLGKAVTGTLTIRTSGGAVLAVLEWDATNGHHNPVCTINCANMNQLTYQFSVNAATELFRWSSAS